MEKIKTGIIYKVVDLCASRIRNGHSHYVLGADQVVHHIGGESPRRFVNLKDDPGSLKSHPSRNGGFDKAIEAGCLSWRLDHDRKRGVFILGGQDWDEEEGSQPTKKGPGRKTRVNDLSNGEMGGMN